MTLVLQHPTENISIFSTKVLIEDRVNDRREVYLFLANRGLGTYGI